MKENFSNKKELIAPCGMNCAICSGYLALRHDVKSRGIGYLTAKVVGLEIKNALF